MKFKKIKCIWVNICFIYKNYVHYHYLFANNAVLMYLLFYQRLKYETINIVHNRRVCRSVFLTNYLFVKPHSDRERERERARVRDVRVEHRAV